MADNTCCVIIPTHTLDLKKYEFASIMQTCNILSNFDVYLVCPQSLNVDSLLDVIPNLKIKKFDDKWFSSGKAYNQLCLQEFLYKAFTGYEYMLIAQTDAWIFKDELLMWCKKQYDYIGAPWCQFCRNSIRCNYEQSSDRAIVGNGGLSLRKISKFVEATRKIAEQKLLDVYIEKSKNLTEDVFFMETCKYLKWNVPKCKEAIRFSIEQMPLFHAQRIMPFGYHNTAKISITAAGIMHFNNNIEKTITDNMKRRTQK